MRTTLCDESAESSWTGAGSAFGPACRLTPLQALLLSRFDSCDSPWLLSALRVCQCDRVSEFAVCEYEIVDLDANGIFVFGGASEVCLQRLSQDVFGADERFSQSLCGSGDHRVVCLLLNHVSVLVDHGAQLHHARGQLGRAHYLVAVAQCKVANLVGQSEQRRHDLRCLHGVRGHLRVQALRVRQAEGIRRARIAVRQRHARRSTSSSRGRRRRRRRRSRAGLLHRGEEGREGGQADWTAAAVSTGATISR